MGHVPARGRADVKHDFLSGKQAAERGDGETCKKFARSLGRFAVKHVPFAVVSVVAAGIHMAHIRSGSGDVDGRSVAEAAYDSFYALLQGSVIFAQMNLSRTLHKQANAVAESEPMEAPVVAQPPLERAAPSILDKRLSDTAHGLFALTLVDVAASAMPDVHLPLL